MRKFQRLIFALFSVLLFACEFESSNEENEKLNYDGKTLFKGIMLGQGPVAA